MPDIELRFNRDMLVLSSPVDTVLARQGIDAARDRQYLNAMEPEVLHDALLLETAAGAQCVVATTQDITRARLAHLRMEGDAGRLARAALDIANSVKPQHTLVEIGPCGLPLDAASKSSLNENRSQYADAARAFEGGSFDAFFLNGFVSIPDLKCALMGVAQVSDKPVFASVVLGSGRPVAAAGTELRAVRPANEDGPSAQGFPGGALFSDYAYAEQAPAPPDPVPRGACVSPDLWSGAIDAMVDLGAAVVGFETADPIADAVAYAHVAAERTSLPLLAQLRVTGDSGKTVGKNLVPLEDVDEYTPDTMAPSAVKLYGAGVQFLRATGLATPAYTGSLAATVLGLDVRGR